MSRSIFHISYSDIVREQERVLKNLQAIKANLARQGNPNLYPITRRIAISERLLKLLKNSDPQQDLFKVNEKLNH